MSTEARPTQDTSIAKIKALLIAARPALVAEGKAIAKVFQQPPAAPGGAVPDRSADLAPLKEHLKELREKVAAVDAKGAAAVNARDVTVRALQETEQAIAKLGDSYGVTDQQASTALLSESVNLLKAARASGILAGKALGIPWPLQ